VTPLQAEQMGNIARRETAFPIVVNSQVVAELNRLLGTPDGRRFLQDSTRRMGAQRAAILQQFTRHALPAELLAIPLVESGYRNRSADANAAHGAGIWMFVAPTAHAFGLRVDARHDDRLNPRAETGAATELLSQLHAHFGDWALALLAYNGGRAAVDRAISQARTRDAFRLAELGYENDPHYLARVTAVIIAMKNSFEVKP
jgi:membrane-bound lytic murein transglycosylase D